MAKLVKRLNFTFRPLSFKMFQNHNILKHRGRKVHFSLVKIPYFLNSTLQNGVQCTKLVDFISLKWWRYLQTLRHSSQYMSSKGG
ncbi:hypothetical protein MTR_5g064170 [Medicago truncatula]|uniref:Uncharacterized protein n=1 Tax=Medicago truncatula TaxID=3880 RepID=G7KBB2_MEDTR|nr:hypothetical protein MTR_5g064170 [Medicago truncatula]